MRRSPLKRKGYLKRRNPERRNPERKAKAFSRHFGSVARVEWINSHPCSCGGAHPDCRGRTVNAHVKSRGAGGTWRDIIPLSYFCHIAQGNRGWSDYAEQGGLTKREAQERAAVLACRGPRPPLG